MKLGVLGRRYLGTACWADTATTWFRFPDTPQCTASPSSQLLSEAEITECVERAKVGGGEIVKLMGTSAYYAPASGSVQMAEAIIKDKKRILPCAAYCDAEYGVGGYFVGVPCILGSSGVEKVIEIDLDETERGADGRVDQPCEGPGRHSHRDVPRPRLIDWLSLQKEDDF